MMSYIVLSIDEYVFSLVSNFECRWRCECRQTLVERRAIQLSGFRVGNGNKFGTLNSVHANDDVWFTKFGATSFWVQEMDIG